MSAKDEQPERTGTDESEAKPARVTIEVGTGTVVKVVAILFGLYLITRVWSVILLVGLAIMIATALVPYLSWLEERKLPRPLALIVAVGTLVAFLIGLLAAIVPGLVSQTRNFIKESPSYELQLQKLLAHHGVHVHLHNALKQLPKWIEHQNGLLSHVATSVFDGVVGLATIIVLALYLLVDHERIVSFFVASFPGEHRPNVRRALKELRKQVGGYVRGQVISSLLASIFSVAILFPLGIPNFLTLSAFVFLADFVPMFGQTVGTVPAVLVALTVSPVKALIVLIGFVLYQQVENHFIVPKVYANTLQISPLVALVGLLLGASLLGLVGMLIALPIIASAPVILEVIGVRVPKIAADSSEPD